MKPEITVNTQSSIRIQTADTVIRFDPFRIAGAPHDADLVLITHDHYDHFSPEDLRKVCKPGTQLIAPKNMQNTLMKHGFSDTLLLSPGKNAEVQQITVETVVSYNILKPFHPKASGNLGYIITADGLRIYAAGDTDAVKELRAVRCDTAFVPIGGTYTMNAKEAAALVNEIRPQTAVPIHYGSIVGKMHDGEFFRELVDSSIEVRLLLQE